MLEYATGPGPRRVVVHADVDAFLASAEQAADPSLRGRPVVVGGLPRDRGIVISSSYEARALGVRNGMRLRDAHRVCPRAVFRRGAIWPSLTTLPACPIPPVPPASRKAASIPIAR